MRLRRWYLVPDVGVTVGPFWTRRAAVRYRRRPDLARSLAFYREVKRK